MSDSDPASADLYTDLPLDPARQQVRLLRVIKNSSQPIECTLEVFDLDRALQYTALSYRWGSANTDYTISVNGQSLRASENLFYFLETYRRDEKDQYLWIDQICIAQTNVKERNHQVGLMRRTYSQCQSTIVWLCDSKDRYPVIAKEFNRTHTKKALLGLLNDSYFTRLWIVQEVLLSSNIWVFTSGNAWIPWHSIRDCFLTKAWGPEHAIHKALLAPEAIFQGESPTLGECILTFSGQSCARLKDKVYGLLGIVQQSDRFAIDYSKSIDEVYLDAVIAVGPHGRDECAERLGDYFQISSSRIERLLAFLDFVQPIHFIEELSVLRDCSPTTQYGSGLVSSIGVVVSEEPAVPTLLRSDTPKVYQGLTIWGMRDFSNNEKVTALAAPRESHDALWTNAFNAPQGGSFKLEVPTASDDGSPDTGPPFDPVQSIIDFYHCLKKADWDHDQAFYQTWEFQEQIAAKLFWTHVALRKGELQPEHPAEPAQPLKYLSRWCYGYQGNVYEYVRQPRWNMLFGIRREIVSMQYIVQACSRVRTILYNKPTIITEEAAIYPVRRRHREGDAGPQMPARKAHWVYFTPCIELEP